MDFFPSNNLGEVVILLFAVFMLVFGIGAIAGFAPTYGLLVIFARRNNTWTKKWRVALSLVGAFYGAVLQ